MNRRNAFVLMLDAHHGQCDKAGEPYFFHCLAVEEAVAGLGEDFAVVALLHDIFEDTPRKIEDYLPLDEVEPLEDLLSGPQARALIAITKHEGESYAEYLGRVRENFIAKVVKWADLNHNLSPERQDGLEPDLAKKLEVKYERARGILLEREEA